jgi:hypothetical protein
MTNSPLAVGRRATCLAAVDFILRAVSESGPLSGGERVINGHTRIAVIPPLGFTAILTPQKISGQIA